MYGGVRGRKTKVGEKLLRFPPTRLSYLYGWFWL
jgi:putative ABC transport system permease protein